MRRSRRPLAAVLPLALLALGCASNAPPPGPEPQAAVACATVVSTNDEHGRLLPETPPWAGGRAVGGVAALGGYYRDLRASAGDCPVFVLSGGDMMQGTVISNLVDGESTIAVLNALGYDAAAIGNHEFDWGVEVLLERMAQAEFPLLGANIYLAGTDRHPEWVVPWAILEKRGVRVGVVGAATEDTPYTTNPVRVQGLEFRPISEALDRYIPELRARGVDFVVAAMHAGGFCEDGSCAGEAIRELERAAAPFDYAVTGHTHSRIETRVRGAPVVQAFSNTSAFSVGRLRKGADGQVEGEVVEIRTAWADEVAPDPELEALVRRYEDQVAQAASRPVATLAERLEQRRHGDYGLGRLIADAQRAATGAQAALMNNGGIRTALPAGAVTYGDLFAVQPFQNTLVLLRLSGSLLLAALDHAVQEEGPRAQLSGLRAEFDAAAPPGSRILAASLTDGTPIRPDGTYLVSVNDFMAAGGSGYEMLKEAEDAHLTGIVDVDALVEHLRSLPQPVRAPTDARWIPAGGG